jgi:hypothetical protein
MRIRVIIICAVDESLDWIAEILIASIADAATPSAVLFLLRKYRLDALTDDRDAVTHGVTHGGDALKGVPRTDNVRTAIEAGLTSGLQAVTSTSDPRERCQWLGVFAEAAAISDDDRLVQSVQQHLAPTIDGLERLARSEYEPGEGLVDGELRDHVRSALAFLTAFELTGRLPYSMLAEELLQAARRRWWADDRGSFGDSFGANAGGVQLLCRLAVLHRDAEYFAAAVVATDANYARDAERILGTLAPIARAHLDDVAEYGLALVDWFALRALPN